MYRVNHNTATHYSNIAFYNHIIC